MFARGVNALKVKHSEGVWVGKQHLASTANRNRAGVAVGATFSYAVGTHHWAIMCNGVISIKTSKLEWYLMNRECPKSRTEIIEKQLSDSSACHISMDVWHDLPTIEESFFKVYWQRSVVTYERTVELYEGEVLYT